MGELFANVEPINVYYERKIKEAVAEAVAEKDELAGRLAEKDELIVNKDKLIASLQKQLQELKA